MSKSKKNVLLAKELDEDYIVKIYIPFPALDSAVPKLTWYAWRQQSRKSKSKDHRSSSQDEPGTEGLGTGERSCAGLCCNQLCIFSTGVDTQRSSCGSASNLTRAENLRPYLQWHRCVPTIETQQKFFLITELWDITAHEANFKILTKLWTLSFPT